jgi:hypothetical protein
MEAKAPHIIILATDEGKSHFHNLETVHHRKEPPVSFGSEAV